MSRSTENADEKKKKKNKKHNVDPVESGTNTGCFCLSTDFYIKSRINSEELVHDRKFIFTQML